MCYPNGGYPKINSVGIFHKVLYPNLLCFGWCQSGELVTCLESGDLLSLS